MWRKKHSSYLGQKRLIISSAHLCLARGIWPDCCVKLRLLRAEGASTQLHVEFNLAYFLGCSCCTAAHLDEGRAVPLLHHRPYSENKEQSAVKLEIAEMPQMGCFAFGNCWSADITSSLGIISISVLWGLYLGFFVYLFKKVEED